MSALPPSPELSPAPVARLHESRLERRAPPSPAAETIREDYFGNARLHGRVALIAGACSEVGRAIVAHCAREGAKIVVVYPSNAAVARQCEWLARSEGSDCFLIRSAMPDAPACKDVVASVVDYFGHLDIVVNCIDSTAASVGESLPHSSDCADRLSRAALPHMASRGSIINTVANLSTAAQDPAVDDRHASIRPSTRAMAQAAAAHGIRVNAVLAGQSPALPGSDPMPAATSRNNRNMPHTTRNGQPADIGPACVFLASDDAAFITGQTLHITDRQFGEMLLAG